MLFYLANCLQSHHWNVSSLDSSISLHIWEEDLKPMNKKKWKANKPFIKNTSTDDIKTQSETNILILLYNEWIIKISIQTSQVIIRYY